MKQLIKLSHQVEIGHEPHHTTSYYKTPEIIM